MRALPGRRGPRGTRHHRAWAAMVALALAMAAPAPAAADDDDGDDEDDDDVESEVTVRNKKPVVETIELDAPDEDPGSGGPQLSPTPGGTRSVPFRATAKDNNGRQDLTRVTYAVLDAGGATVASGDAAATGGGQGSRREFAAAWELPYWLAPGDYALNVAATDRRGDTGTGSLAFQVLAVLAMDLDVASIRFGGAQGEVEPGASNHASPAAVVVTNLGNVALDLGYSGTDLASPPEFGASIPVGRVRYSASPGMEGERSVGTDFQVDADFDLAPGEGASRAAYFDLHAPTGEEQYIPATTYRGTLTLAGVVGG